MTLAPFSRFSNRKPQPDADVLLRIGFNRDESRERPAARPPERRNCGSRVAIMPIDPVSGGSWIAVNDRGLCAALLNAYVSDESTSVPRNETRSRGEIVPLAMECSTLQEARERVRNLVRSAGAFAPFNLVLASADGLLEYNTHKSAAGFAQASPIDDPKIFTSSGLGDALVYGPRKQLFDRMFASTGDMSMIQDSYHRHQWAKRPAWSVCMSRPEAATVSYSVIEIGARGAAMTYFPAAPTVQSDPVLLSIEFRALA